jgi:hypothetical protein
MAIRKRDILTLIVFVSVFAFNTVAEAKTPIFQSSFESETEVKQNFRLDRIENHAWRITDTQKHFGNKGLLIAVKKGDKLANNTERSEFQDPLKITLDEDAWYRIDFKIPKDFPEIDNRLVIWQLKQSGKDSPLIAMNYRNGKLRLKQTFDNNQINYYQPNEKFKDKWVRIVVHANASHSNAGFINVYLNDTQIVQYRGQTAHHNKWAENTYFKFGLYRDVIEIPMQMYYDQYIRGSSWIEVVPEKSDPEIEKNLWIMRKKKIK